MSLKYEYDNLDGALRYLIANSDEEILQLEQAAHPLDTEFRLPTTTQLSAAESARLRDQIESNALAEELLGIRLQNSLDVPGSIVPLGVDGRPMQKASTDALESSFRKLMDAVILGVQRGDPEALTLIESGRSRTLTKMSSDDFRRRMAIAADEFSRDSVAGSFVKAWAIDDQVAMRRALRAIAAEMVSAEM